MGPVLTDTEVSSFPPCAIAEDLEEFAELPDDWGFPGPAVLESLIEVNRRCEAGDPEPARKRDATPLAQPPFYVIEVVPAITMTFAGLLIDPDARVLDEQRNLRRRLPPRRLRRRPQQCAHLRAARRAHRTRPDSTDAVGKVSIVPELSSLI